MEEAQLNPLHAFAVLMVVGAILLSGFIAGLVEYIEVPPLKGEEDVSLELWHNGVLLTDNRVYGDIYDYEIKQSITVTLKNPTLGDLKCSFTHECYPENLSVDVTYGHPTSITMPITIKRGDSLDLAITYWVKDSDYEIASIDIWFDMTAGR